MLRSFKIIFSLAILALLVWLADPLKLLETLSSVSAANFGILMLLSFVMIGVSALKWQLFVSFLAAPVSFLKLFALYLTGYFVNMLFPSYIGGDALRSYYVGKSVGQHQALSATILERYTGLIAMALLGMLAAFYETSLLSLPVRLVVIGLGVAVLICTLIIFFVRFNPERYAGKHKWLKKLFFNIDRLHGLMLETSGQYGLWVKAIIISIVFHVLTVANTYVAAVAVGWTNPPIEQLFIVLPIILILGALPITPSGLGIQEGAFFHFLQLLGATSPQALGVAVLLRAKTYVLALLGWGVWIAMGGRAAFTQKSGVSQEEESKNVDLVVD